MKRFCLQCLLLILFTGFAFSVFAEENVQRQWKSGAGRVILTGTFEKFNPADPTSIYIRSSNGKLYQYPFNKLSKEDQEFIQSLDGEDADLVEVEEDPEESVQETSKSRGNDNSNSKAEKETGKRYALLVGVNHYLDLNQLECAVADIQLIQEKLLQLGFEPENIKMYITGNSIGKYPDKKTIEAGFQDILSEADENSQVFIAFAGHGFEIDNVSYFAVEDTRVDSNDDLKKTAINVNAMFEDLKKCKASSKWFIVDACREYMIPKRSSRLTKISRGINSGLSGGLPEGVFFLQSCKSSESSYEYNGNGLFTRSFAEALDGKADANKDGDLTVLEVFSYVATNVRKDAQNLLSKRQTPTFFIPGNTPNFSIASTANLLQHGLSNKEWDKVQKLYDDSLKLLADNKKEEGLDLLDQALEMMKNADDDAPLKERITIVSKQVRASIEERKKLEEELEKERTYNRNQVSTTPARTQYSLSPANTQGHGSAPNTQTDNDGVIPEIQDGLNALQNNDIEGCLKKFEEARRTHPEFSPAELMLAKVLLQIDLQTNATAAENLVERCISNHPNDPEAYLFLAESHLGKGHITDAYNNYLRAGVLLKNFQGDVQRRSAMVRQFNIGMATVLERRGEYEKAKAYRESYEKFFKK